MESTETIGFESERDFTMGDVERELLPAFMTSGETPPLPGTFVRATVRLVALVCSEDDTMRVRFESLDPDALVEELQGPKPRIEPFVRDFLWVAAAFYRWLGAREHIPGPSADAVALALDVRRAE